MKIAFVSTNAGHWGGSEELWSQTALRFRGQGHEVSALLSRPNAPHPKIEELVKAGAKLESVSADNTGLAARIWNRSLGRSRSIQPGSNFRDSLRRNRPTWVLGSMGAITESFRWARICREESIPYAVLIQQASEIDGPTNERLTDAVEALEHAFAVFFVSEANRSIVQEQVGLSLPLAEVARNPVMVDVASSLAWPPDDNEWLIACPARMVLRDKGQDVLVRVLSLPKWRERALKVTLYGQGRHSESLRRMVTHLNLTSVRFGGQSANIADVWRHHHACVLPSRVEGLPLALVEAMWCGRPAIVTDVGGNSEVVEDNETGFIARTPAVIDLDEALERAWVMRHEWETMGGLAATEIRKLVPPDPAATFADRLLEKYEASTSDSPASKL